MTKQSHTDSPSHLSPIYKAGVARGLHAARSAFGDVPAKHDAFMYVFASCSHPELQGSQVGVRSICFTACVASGKASDPGQADVDFLFCFLSPWFVSGSVCLLFPSRGWLKPSGRGLHLNMLPVIIFLALWLAWTGQLNHRSATNHELRTQTTQESVFFCSPRWSVPWRQQMFWGRTHLLGVGSVLPRNAGVCFPHPEGRSRFSFFSGVLSNVFMFSSFSIYF